MVRNMTRREQEHQQHIRHILDVAESTFAEKGFVRTTMRQIALRAEFALGTIYSHFQNKKGLYEKVIQTKANALVSFVVREMEGELSALGKVEKFVEAKMTFLHENLSFMRLYLLEMNVPVDDAGYVVHRKVRERYDSMLRSLTDVIRQGIREGLFKPMDAEVLARTLDGLTNAFALSWLRSEKRRPIEAELRIARELFLYGVALCRQVDTEVNQDKGTEE